MLAHNKFTVTHTRTTDVFRTLVERYTQANRENVDFMISIHANSDSSTAFGIETIVRTSGSVAHRMATRIQHHMVRQSGDRDRGVKFNTGLAVINGTKMPCCLPEVGFISHRPTEDKLRLNTYLENLADAIGRGIAEHLGTPWASLIKLPSPLPPPAPPLAGPEPEPPATSTVVIPCPYCEKRVRLAFGPNSEIDAEKI